ncbi:MAG TPA: DUF4911 domain-containing protein [Peptococcaceae bacterium]|nr:DUF4911 domain-containing protein [Peptococcaceae bacterium]
MEKNKQLSSAEDPWQDSDFLLKAKVSRPDIQLLVKYVEGLGHLGTVTTLDRGSGEVLIQTTKYCWPDLKKNIEKLPIVIQFMEV